MYGGRIIALGEFSNLINKAVSRAIFLLSAVVDLCK